MQMFGMPSWLLVTAGAACAQGFAGLLACLLSMSMLWPCILSKEVEAFGCGIALAVVPSMCVAVALG